MFKKFFNSFVKKLFKSFVKKFFKSFVKKLTKKQKNCFHQIFSWEISDNVKKLKNIFKNLKKFKNSKNMFKNAKKNFKKVKNIRTLNIKNNILGISFGSKSES